jgi:hypothetical protein
MKSHSMLEYIYNILFSMSIDFQDQAGMFIANSPHILEYPGFYRIEHPMWNLLHEAGPQGF